MWRQNYLFEVKFKGLDGKILKVAFVASSLEAAMTEALDYRRVVLLDDATVASIRDMGIELANEP